MAQLSAAQMQEVQRLGKEALLLSARLNRPLTRNDLYLTLHVGWDILDPLMEAISQVPKVALEELTPEEWNQLENASQAVVSKALRAVGPRILERGVTLADVAANSPADWSLDQILQLFGYIVAVLQLPTLPPRESWPIEVHDLVRKARTIPVGERTVLGLVAALGTGVYRAKLVMATLR